jgi:Sec-independent protein translocase protein TatA
MFELRGIELIIIIVIAVIVLLVVGPSRIGRFFGNVGRGFRDFQAGWNAGKGQDLAVGSTTKKKHPLRFILGIAGLIGGYMIGSSLLPALIYTRNELFAMQNGGNAYSGLLADFSGTAVLGGIIGAILFCVIGMFAARMMEK